MRGSRAAGLPPWGCAERCLYIGRATGCGGLSPKPSIAAENIVFSKKYRERVHKGQSASPSIQPTAVIRVSCSREPPLKKGVTMHIPCRVCCFAEACKAHLAELEGLKRSSNLIVGTAILLVASGCSSVPTPAAPAGAGWFTRAQGHRENVATTAMTRRHEIRGDEVYEITNYSAHSMSRGVNLRRHKKLSPDMIPRQLQAGGNVSRYRWRAQPAGQAPSKHSARGTNNRPPRPSRGGRHES